MTQCVPINTRDTRSDLIRGLAIWGVVFAHGSNLLLKHGVALIPVETFSWPVPVFVILSAFFSAGSILRNDQIHYWQSVRKRLLRLGIPFLAWSVLYLIVERKAWHLSILKIITQDFAGYGWSGQYYFIILLQSAFILPVLARMRFGVRTVIASFAALETTVIILPNVHWHPDLLRKILDDRFLPFWIPHLLLGVWLTRIWHNRLRSVMPAAVGWLLLLACSVIFANQVRICSAFGSGLWVGYQTPVDVLLSPLFFFALVSAVTTLPTPIAGVVRQLGVYSLGIFCINPLMIRLIVMIPTRGIDASPRYWILTHGIAPFVTVSIIVILCGLGSRFLELIGLKRLVR
jgi:hypothetical protein